MYASRMYRVTQKGRYGVQRVYNNLHVPISSNIIVVYVQ